MTERCHCGGVFVPGVGVVPLLRCAACGREVPAAAMPSCSWCDSPMPAGETLCPACGVREAA